MIGPPGVLEGVNGHRIWEGIVAGHLQQEGLLDELGEATKVAAEAKHEHGKVRALAKTAALVQIQCLPSQAGAYADDNENVLGAKLQSDLRAGELMVVKERLKTLEGQLKRLQSGFVSWRAP